jgi:hypothetical protein
LVCFVMMSAYLMTRYVMRKLFSVKSSLSAQGCFMATSRLFSTRNEENNETPSPVTRFAQTATQFLCSAVTPTRI